MIFSPGERIGGYEITWALGAGGMGEVYRAHDSQLNRDVALKVLSGGFVRDPDRRARFTREAQTLAALNHPNIAQIHGLETVPRDDDEPSQVLVMEFVEGEDLAHRIGRGPVPVHDVLPIARQIAEALEAAHERGIVHRDLKPANVMVRADGAVKVLDFGLAKALDQGSGIHAHPSSDAQATLTSPALTGFGMIMGTAAYMSPEQARGRPVDKRTDVWSFGVVLYEMLTGKRLFGGDTMTDVLAGVVGRDPDWGALPADTPPWTRRLLERCLIRDPKARLRDIGEARIAFEVGDLDSVSGTPAPPADAPPAARRASRRLAELTAAVLLGGVVTLFIASSWRQQPAGEGPVVRAQVVLAPDASLAVGMRPTFALTPDGTTMVTAVRRNDVTQLYRRSLAEESDSPITGSEDGSGPFFSPDGLWLGFFAEGRLKKVDMNGGTPVVLGEAPAAQGGSFAPDGAVVFSPVHGAGLWRVPPDGGPAVALTTVDTAQGEAGHHWPHMLPDGRHLVMTVELNGKPYSDARIVLVSLETKEQRVLVEGGTDARYLPAGYLVYWRQGDLWAVPFDATAGRVTGARFLAERGVMASEANGFAEYAFSQTGVLAFLRGPHPGSQHGLALVDRAGAAQPLLEERQAYETPRVSPDGARLAVNIAGANDNLWVYDFSRRALTRLTFDDENRRPVWSPDGRSLAFTSHGSGRPHHIVVLPIDGSAQARSVREADRSETPESWSASGQLVHTLREPGTGSDVWTVPIGDGAQPRALLNSRFEEGEARVSFDGRWLAYESTESGRPEVYVRAFPGLGGKRQISIGGGQQPRWRKDGGELYYLRGGDVMVVGLAGEDRLTSAPRLLFSGAAGEQSLDFNVWDVMPDGSAFVMIQNLGAPPRALNVALGWFEQLRTLESRGSSTR